MDNKTPLRVVAIGGGTGLSAMLHGLKQYAQGRFDLVITDIIMPDMEGME